MGELERLDWNLNRDELEGLALQQNHVGGRKLKYLEQALLTLFNLGLEPTPKGNLCVSAPCCPHLLLLLIHCGLLAGEGAAGRGALSGELIAIGIMSVGGRES